MLAWDVNIQARGDPHDRHPPISELQWDLMPVQDFSRERQ